MDGLCNCGRPSDPGKGGLCAACYNRKYYHAHKENCLKSHNLSMAKRAKDGKRRSACSIIKQHHESMKDDPEHLTTEFIKKFIKVDCKDI